MKSRKLFLSVDSMHAILQVRKTLVFQRCAHTQVHTSRLPALSVRYTTAARVGLQQPAGFDWVAVEG